MVINVKKGDCSQGGQVLGFRGIRSVGPRLGVAAPNPTLRRKAADYCTQRAINEHGSPLEISIIKKNPLPR